MNYSESDLNIIQPEKVNTQFQVDVYPSFNVLIFLLGPKTLYRPVILSKKEIFCSPACETKTDGEFFRTIKTPGGVFDIAEIVNQLPRSQKPDMIVVKADATGHNFPINMQIFDGPKLLIVGDTHHFSKPIQTLMDYASQEKFDFIMCEHDRHHLHYFKEVGCEKVFWIPGFNVNPYPQKPCLTPKYSLSFVGQVGQFHPYRKYILSHLKQLNLPLNQLQAPPNQASQIYSESAINLNISLNGDLNLRVFEVLASGGFLLTDRLSKQSGLELIFENGKHLAFFKNDAELKYKISYFLDDREAAREIAKNGSEAFWSNHRPEVNVKRVIDYVSGQDIEPIYLIENDKRSIYISNNNLEALRSRLRIYEYLQKLHLTQPHIRGLFGAQVDAKIICDAVDLPRLSIHLIFNPLENSGLSNLFYKCEVYDQINFISVSQLAKNTEQWDLIAFTWAELQTFGIDALLCMLNFQRLVIADICGNLGKEEAQRLDSFLERRGFIKDSVCPLVYHWQKKAEWGNLLQSQEKYIEAIDAFERALQDNPADVSALLELGLIAFQLNNLEYAEKLWRQAVSLERRNLRAIEYLAQVLKALNRYEEAANILKHLLLSKPSYTYFWSQLENCYQQIGLQEKSLAAYRFGRELRQSKIEGSRAISTSQTEEILWGMRSTAKTLLKRILVINNLYPPQELGGYGRSICDFVNILSQRGHTIQVLTSDAPYLGQITTPEPNVERDLLLFGTFDGETKLIEDRNQIRHVIDSNDKIIRNTIEKFVPDVCLVGNINFLSPSVFKPLLENYIPVIYHLGLPMLLCSANEIPNSPLFVFATASEYVKQKVLSQGYQSDNIVVIYPGAIVQQFEMCILPCLDKLRIVYSGLFIPSKGTHTLIEALKILKDSNVDFECSLAGDSFNQEFVAAINEFITYHGMSDKVRLLGYLQREQLINLFSINNVIVFPSIGPEAFGISPVEGMAAGLTAITTGVGGSSEVVECGISGLTFTAGNAESLANSLMSLIQDRERWKRIATAGRDRAKELFDINCSVDILETQFDKLLLQRNSNEEFLSKKVQVALCQNLKLREVNLIVFPDWSQPEELLSLELEKIIELVILHPEKNNMTLLIEGNNISEEVANLALSHAAINVLMNNDLEAVNVPEVSIIGQLSEIEWRALLPCIQARIVLKNENVEAIARALAENIPAYELDSLSHQRTIQL